MRIKQTWLHPRKHLRQVSLAVAVLLLAGAPLQRAFATGGPAGFAFADNNSAFNVGGVIDVELLESGTDVQTVWANLSYPASLLQFQQAGFDNSLNTVAAGGVDCSVDPASGNGQVSLRCTANTPPNGTEIVADLRFLVLAPGTATLSMVAGGNSATDITNNTGASIWDGALPHVTYTLKGKALSGGSTTAPSTGSTGGSAAPGTGSASTGGSTASGSNTPAASGSQGALSFSISDALGRPLGGARVAISESAIQYTDTDGKTSFGLAAGTYDIGITAPGVVSQSLKTTIAAGKSKRFSLQLSPAAPGAAFGLFALIVLAAYFGRSRLQRVRLMLPGKSPQLTGGAPITGIVVGDGGLTLEDTAAATVPLQQPAAAVPAPAMSGARPAVPGVQPGAAAPFLPYSYPAQPGPMPVAQPQYPPQSQYPAQPPTTPRKPL